MPRTLNEKREPHWIEAVITDKGGWANKHYGVRGGSRGDCFYGPVEWIKELEKYGMARRASTAAPGPETVKPAGPKTTKPAGPKETKKEDLAKKTVKELRQIAKDRGVSTGKLNKAGLVTAIESAA